jgi:hypothetical protein
VVKARTGQTAAFAPDSVSVGARHVEVGGEWVASFAVTGYPGEVHPGWLSPLLTYPGRLDVAVHVEPIDPATAAARLKKQLAKLESGRRHTAEHGRLYDPQVEAATEDAYDLSARVARGEGKLFRVGLYLTIHAPTDDTLADEVAALRSLCASLLLDAKPTTYRSLQGWVSTLPMGLDLIRMRRTFDTSALAAAFPFTSPDLPVPTSATAPSGVLYGFNLGSQGLVHWDRFGEGMHNHNAVILGRSGAGKSYLVKLELLRSLYRGIEVAVIDPEDEYARLAAAVGGTYVHLGASGVRLNPFDLPIHTRPDGRRTAPKDALVRRSLFLHTVISVLVGGTLEAGQRAALDRAIAATYQKSGITTDPRTWTRPAPTLRNLRDQLAAGDGAASELAARLHPFVDGAWNGLFDGPTTTNPEGHLVVFGLRDLPDELKAIGTLLTLDAVWRRVSNPAIRRPGSSWSTRRGCSCANTLARNSCSAWPKPPANTGPDSPSPPKTSPTSSAATSAKPSWRTRPPKSCSAKPPRPSTTSPEPSTYQPGNDNSYSQRTGAKVCSRRAPSAWHSRQLLRPANISTPRATRPN